jgi:hypothetical protein
MRARLLTRLVRLAIATVLLGACSLDHGGTPVDGAAGAGGEPPSSSSGAGASTNVGSTSSGASSVASTAVGASVGGASSSSSGAGGDNAGGGGSAAGACSGPGTFEEPIGKHCYQLNDPASQLPWDQARQSCLAKGIGWDLAVVTTFEEVTFLDGQLTAVDHLWIGAQDVPPSDDAVFGWIDGSPWSFDFDPWGIGEPNNVNGDEDCLMLWNDTAVFNDSACYKPWNWLCERAP